MFEHIFMYEHYRGVTRVVWGTALYYFMGHGTQLNKQSDNLARPCCHVAQSVVCKRICKQKWLQYAFEIGPKSMPFAEMVGYSCHTKYFHSYCFYSKNSFMVSSVALKQNRNYFSELLTLELFNIILSYISFYQNILSKLKICFKDVLTANLSWIMSF